MFDTHEYLTEFYRHHVQLGVTRRQELKEHSDACLNLLRDGLQKLGWKSFLPPLYQGSYAMKTLNQHPRKEYDIDVAVVFKAEDLPDLALNARQRVAKALRATGRYFATKPLARTNAVTLWYSTGEHVDLAVYRESKTFWGTPFLEHAGSKWRQRDPTAVTRWFDERDKDLSPDPALGAKVARGQFRRVVRLIKAFARSRMSWRLPGGMILSALVSKVYKPDPQRDDVALYNTLVALQEHLRGDPEIPSPVTDGESLAPPRSEKATQVRQLLEKLDYVLPRLDVLMNSACLKHQALSAWAHVFNHDYWRDQARAARLESRNGPALLKIRADIAKERGGSITARYRGSTAALPKGTWLRLSLKKSLELDPSLKVRWHVYNRGGEAVDAGVRQYEKDTHKTEFWAETRYEGRHSITCEIRQGEQPIARGVRHIQVARG